MQPLSPVQQRLVTANVGIAYAVMQRLNIHGKGFAEAKGEAMVALCEAAATYTAQRGAFSTWAWAKVGWHLKTWMTKTNRRVKALDSAFCGLHDCATSAANWSEHHENLADEGASPEDAVEGSQVERLIEEHLADGSPLTQQVGRLALRGLTKEEIAAELGVSVSTVARRRKEARELLSPIREILSIADSEAPWHNL